MKVCQFSREGVQGGWIPAESRGRSGAGKGARGSRRYYYQTEFISRPTKFTWMSLWGGGGLYLVPCCERDPGAQQEGGWMRVGAPKEEI